MREELEPCPFCGSRDVDPEGWMAGAPGVLRTGPACTGCGASAEDTAAWNTRAKPPQPADDNHKALVEALWGAERRLRLTDDGEDWDFAEKIVAVLSAFQSRQEEK